MLQKLLTFLVVFSVAGGPRLKDLGVPQDGQYKQMAKRLPSSVSKKVPKRFHRAPDDLGRLEPVGDLEIQNKVTTFIGAVCFDEVGKRYDPQDRGYPECVNNAYSVQRPSIYRQNNHEHFLMGITIPLGK